MQSEFIPALPNGDLSVAEPAADKEKLENGEAAAGAESPVVSGAPETSPKNEAAQKKQADE